MLEAFLKKPHSYFKVLGAYPYYIISIKRITQILKVETLLFNNNNKNDLINKIRVTKVLLNKSIHIYIIFVKSVVGEWILN